VSLVESTGRDQIALPVGALEAVPHVSGALYLPAERALLVADLHLEKGSALADRGILLPPYDSRSTLAALARAVMAFLPRRVIALGDSFHDPAGASRLPQPEREALAGLQAGRDWLWLTGNHDPEAGPGLEGEVARETVIGGVRLVHEPTARGTGPEIAGHLHPVAKIALRGKRLRRRCFVSDGTRLVMPAMGAYAGGLNVRDGAFQRLFDDGADAWMIGDARVFAIHRAMLLPD
jgi:hypothetical protein